MSREQENSAILPSIAAGVGAGGLGYGVTRSIDISDKNDLVQQRLISAYKKNGAAVGFPEGKVLRARLAKIIYDPKFKYYSKKSNLNNAAPGVLFSKSKPGYEGGVTINGPEFRKAVRQELRDKENFHKLPYIGEYFKEAKPMDKVLLNHGYDITNMSDAEFKNALIDIQKKEGNYFYKPKASHSMIGYYGHSYDLEQNLRRKDISFVDRLLNKDVKKEYDPELISGIRKNISNLIVTPDYGLGKEIRLEILNETPTFIHRFGLKKGLKLDPMKEFGKDVADQLYNFADKYKKYTRERGGYSKMDEVPFVGADLFINPSTKKVHGVELQWNSGFPFHAKSVGNMVSKPYGSTHRLAEYITGKPSHVKGMLAAAAVGIPSGLLIKKYLDEK